MALNTPAITPYLTVDNAKAAAEFYKKAFGASELERQETPDGKKLVHCALNIHGGIVMLSDDFPEMSGGQSRTPKAFGGSPVMISLAVAEVDAVWNEAVKAGAKVVMPLADQYWGDRFGIIEDPAGHRWSLSTPRPRASAEELNKGAEKHFGKQA